MSKLGWTFLVMVVSCSTISIISAAVLRSSWSGLLGSEDIFPMEINSIEFTSNSNVLNKLQELLDRPDFLKGIYSNFVTKYGKDRDANDLTRQENFKTKVLEVATHNLEALDGIHSWTKAVNEFSDMTTAEFHSIYTRAESASKVSEFYGVKKPLTNFTRLQQSDSKDWRDDKIVTPVKHQGQCGSCYAFASVAVAESLNIKKTGKTLILSEQELVDCSDNGACGGGNSPTSWDYMKNGLSLQKDYPYRSETFKRGQKGNCNSRGKKHYVKVGGYDQIQGDEDNLAQAVYNYGPVSILINSRGWGDYEGGIYEGGCGQELDGETNHLVTIVGYTPDYWIIKNSWGNWGEKGYMRMQRGSNLCDVTGNVFAITNF